MKITRYHFIGKMLLILAVSVGLSACHGGVTPTEEGPKEPYTETTDRNIIGERVISAEDRQACISSGGAVVRGLIGEVCAQSHADAGKACTDGSECLGDCVADMDMQNATSGLCTPTTPFFGCFSRIENGQADSAICVD